MKNRNVYFGLTEMPPNFKLKQKLKSLEIRSKYTPKAKLIKIVYMLTSKIHFSIFRGPQIGQFNIDFFLTYYKTFSIQGYLVESKKAESAISNFQF